MKNGDLSRRSFLAASGVTVAGVAALGLVGCDQSAGAEQGATDASAEYDWKYEADVVVVGFGGAGAVAAITACDNDASVIVLEKSETGGGNTCVSLGGFLNVTDVDAAITYVKHVFEYTDSYMDEDWVQKFCEMSAETNAWIESIAPDYSVIKYGGANYPQVEGAESQEKCKLEVTESTSAMALYTALEEAVQERGAEVLYNTPGTELITNANNEIIGIIADENGTAVNIKANKGVILACGGYEASDYHIRNFIKGYPIVALGNPANTGDGIRMAQQVGAELWHMNGGGSVTWGIKADTEAAARPVMKAESYIWVDRNGKRFNNEKGLEGHAVLFLTDGYSSEELRYPRIPAYYVFDDTVRSAGPAVEFGYGWAAIKEEISWSDDNLAEIEKGFILKGETVEELAEKIGCTPEDLSQTVTKWNDDITAGNDSEFGRDVEKSAPLSTPPFYAMEVYPAWLNTQGGPKRDTECRVLDVDGNPIPGLYSAGELGSFWGAIYQGAGSIGECIVTGRIAGEAVAAASGTEA